MNLITIFTEITTEQPEWLEQLLKLWQDAGGWLKALVALVGIVPLVLGGFKIKDVLKQSKLNKLITTLATTVYGLVGKIENVTNEIKLLNENNIKDKEIQTLLNKKIDNFRLETKKTQDTLATVLALTNAPVDIKKEVLKVVNNEQTKTAIEDTIKNDELVVEELEIDLE